MLPHALTTFRIQKPYQNNLKFNDVYSRNNFSKIKEGAYSVNLDEDDLIASHQIAVYVNVENVTYFDIFAVEHIPKEIRKIIGNKNVKNKL